MNARTALVTGASSGIGLEVAKLLVQKGYRVIGTSRNPDTIAADKRLPGVEYLALDLADRDSVAACAQAAGDVDIVVNNAGESQSGPLEELPADAVDRLFQTNVFGAVQLTQPLLPGMRERGYGRVIMVGSMLASFPLAFRGSYVAAKAALKGFACAARQELSPFGVWVTTVEPGSIATGIGERRTKYVADDSVYRSDFDTMIDNLDRNERAGITPKQVAEVIVNAIEADPPREFYAVGSNAPLVFLLKRLVPVEVVSKIVAKRHGLQR
ncbi:Short-chain dehydrogenase/reductase SDR OS=Tsukamurella paurometabola (strain ATCC 8368 / DSM/ CCUG 35730 / CIP 100753 / JCM 10117 / KCTC 9821 / NBRC 16120/ NCIMB 702349 / NCTC 13040) OX=521096 GN=Tpau_3993 PE=3 SV=1 [Tsukamurella paurometabola]|uniref:Short-chain dehydrogenase/reductase SDR n=1 Tax=Tsukamurella paurometabola (strain ATCC 8368 / DSM 20162 / CCUG 35730 / CIP 100753 / JCM 10117 / KCTC 9821 / NBRC 16120 / NCIMB 702349 / NCTC 13040) TaxID=521096 RepID=D5UN69_TSUPD|nr:SDR family oxidoreductase [Tsukamurella paurometabola]ADG80564.1 short-chain dehydrogenase/reductase SDR [Tsukamurella paurometabola DSM 20162]SUP40110.1 3-oxoacyl-[acyl-carrier-protein] reductase FabG [Tsukamurella paurometabola]